MVKRKKQSNETGIELTLNPDSPKPIKARLFEVKKGDTVTAKPGDRLLIEGNIEYVISQTLGRLTIIRNEGNGEIFYGSRVLNNSRLLDYEQYSDCRMIRVGTKEYSQYDKLLR